MPTLSLSPARTAVAAAAAVGFLVAPGAAQARPACGPDSVPCPQPVAHVGTFNGGGKALLAVKALPRTSSKTIRRVHNGAKAYIVCQTTGSSVTGPYGTSRIWDRLQKGGYISDTRVYTGSDGRVAPDCNPSAPTPTPTPTPTSAPDKFMYDDPGPWTGPSGCAPGFTAGAQAFKTWLHAHYRYTNDLQGYACRQNTANSSQMSVHAEGRAIDWMGSVSNAAVVHAMQRFINTVRANNWALARAMGIQEIIWNHKIWTSFHHAEGFRAYTGPNPHTDHMHIGLNRAGAAKKTSFYR